MEFLRSTNNQHVGVNLKSSCHNYDGCLLLLYFFRVTVSGAPGGGKNCFLMESSRLVWSLVFIVCYQVCFGALSQSCAIGFPMLFISWNVDRHWPVSHRDGMGASPTGETLSRAREDAAHISVFSGNQEGAFDTRLTPLSVWDKEGREDSLRRWIHL